MICPNCGKEAVGKFCPACGAKMPAIDETVVLNDANNPWKKAAEAAAKAAEPVAPAQEQPAPNQGFAPNRPAPSQPFVPNQAAPSQPFVPNQSASSQPFVPNQGYNPNQAAPNQAAPNQAYAPYPGRNYVPQQGNNPTQATGSFQDLSPAAVGQTPASQLVRKLATSGAWLVATLATTLSFLITCYLNIFSKSSTSILYYIENLPHFKGTEYESQIYSSIGSIAGGLLFSLIVVFLLWKIFGSAASKKNEKMGTGPLTVFKVFFIISLVAVCIALLATVILGVLVLVLGSQSGIDEYTNALKELLLQYNINITGTNANISSMIGVIFGILALILVFAIIYIAKVLKSLTTGKRVIRTGIPDDRVSIFVAVFTLIGGICMLITGVLYFLLQDVVKQILAGSGMKVDMLYLISWGVIFLLNGIASICFASVIFKFRSGMRQLGVRKGVMQRPAQ